MNKTNFVHKKALGQNFLEDRNIIDSLVELSETDKNDTVLEIGAGMGYLSEILADRAKKLFAVEIDDRLIPFLRVKLEKHNNVEIIHQNILKVDIKELLEGAENARVVANLPYYITSDIMEKLLLSDVSFKSVSVMLQKEAALKIISDPKKEGYGPLAVLREIKADFKGSVEVKRQHFTPPPNVDSLFIQLEYKKEAMIQEAELQKLYSFVKRCFLNKRKTLANNLSVLAKISKAETEDLLKKLGISPMARAEELSANDFIGLYKTLKK